MIRCAKCDNDTRTTKLVTAMGDVLVAGTISADPQPISAQVCSACGYIELYAPQVFDQPEASSTMQANPLNELDAIPSTGTLVA